MALDYVGIRDAIAAQIRTQVSGSQVQVERIPMPEMTPKVYVCMERRNAPENRQPLRFGQTTRFLVEFSVWVYAYHLHLPTAISLRDSLLADVELALLHDTQFGRTDVIFSWQEGGEMDYGRGDPGFNVGAEIRLILDLKQVTDAGGDTGVHILTEGGDHIATEGGDRLAQDP